MTAITLSQKIRALYVERILSEYEHDFVTEAYGVSRGGEKPYYLTTKQQENIEVIFERVYQ